MIHTFELSLFIPNVSYFKRCASALGFEQDEIDSIVYLQEGANEYICKTPKPYIEGITSITLFHKILERSMGDVFSLYLKVEPQRLIEGRRTIDLFIPTEENKSLLLSKFHDAMQSIVVDPIFGYLLDISSWSASRIDYTKNIRFSSEEEADNFLRMTHRTSRYVRRNPIYMKECIDPNTGKRDVLESSAEGNKSVKGMFYKKAKQIEEVYTDIPDEEKKQLLQDGANIVRFEEQCNRNKISSLKTKYGFPDRNILHFMDMNIAQYILETAYSQRVGDGDFYSFYHAQKLIKKSSYSPSRKQRLIDTMKLIAQSRGVQKARDNFELGIKVKGMDTTIQGCRSTFNSRLKDIESLGLNPTPIPKDWNITFLENPIDQIRCTNLYDDEPQI